ncbi:MAG: CinA family protein [Frankiales bacterium]|nr:CinA family protein [Frankiales bacterium]
MQQQLAQLVQERGWRFATAESVTAGLVADKAAQGAEASAWFLGGLVAYGTEVKQRLLGVQGDRVVNAETAEQMARGVADLLRADVTVATTGVGGPDPAEDQPAGTVWVGVNVDGQVTSHRLQLDGDPERVCTGAADMALRLVVERLRA